MRPMPAGSNSLDNWKAKEKQSPTESLFTHIFKQPSHCEFDIYALRACAENQVSYLIAKLIRFHLYLEYAWALPAFRKPLLASAAALFLNGMIYFPLLFVRTTGAIIALPTFAIILDVFARFGLGLAGKFQTQRRMRKQGDDQALYPAFNLDHLIERTSQFVVVIFGEFLILTSYIAQGSEVGAHGEFGRSALSIIIALTLVRSTGCRSIGIEG